MIDCMGNQLSVGDLVLCNNYRKLAFSVGVITKISPQGIAEVESKLINEYYNDNAKTEIVRKETAQIFLLEKRGY